MCPDGLRKAYDRFNNEVPFNLDGTWVQVECVSEAAKLCEIRDLLAKQEIEGERQCYERPTGFFDTLITFDSGNRPLSDDILVTPNETGTLTEIRLRVDNRNP